MKFTKILLSSIVLLAMVFGFSMPVHSELVNRGTDSLGNRLIYDSALNITWYDYTNAATYWANQVSWASGLSVSGGDLVGAYDDWRLPTTVDGAYLWGYDGTTTAGYNIISSEMGSLFYSGLGNTGQYDTSGGITGCDVSSPWCLTNTGLFSNLIGQTYWSGASYSADSNKEWIFQFRNGSQYLGLVDGQHRAIAVRSGDIAVVPEPISSTLFIIGGATLGLRTFRKKFKK